MARIVPDIGTIASGMVSNEIDCGLEVKEILIHEAMAAYLEKLANENISLGFLGLEELEKLASLGKKHGFSVKYMGKPLSGMEYEKLSVKQLDYLSRQLAYEEDASLFTSSAVQAKLANAKGIKLILKEAEIGRIRLEKFFDDSTMSVHLKENVRPYAKKGTPGNWEFVAVGEENLAQKDVEEIAREVVDAGRIKGFIEIERFGSTIVQLGLYRIVITKPPFSDGWEITAVRPVKKLNLEDYGLSEKLMARLRSQAEGVLIAGSPGMGKTTFAAALAVFYANQNKIVKTVEAPRDLVLPPEITQYAISHADAQEIHDILLLSRPDYTFFDELRNTADFKLFADLRLAGIGFIGVVHATLPIDAIQRFVGRIELGVIPQIVDTVIFIKDGRLAKVLGLNMVVKVPSGMTEADLARPVVVVSDFETRKPEYEIYSYGEETVVIPVQGVAKDSPLKELAKKEIERELKRWGVEKVEFLSDSKCKVYLPEDKIAMIIGKQGKTIQELEMHLGISIDVEELKIQEQGNEAGFEVLMSGKSLTFKVESGFIDKNCNIFVNDDFLLTAKVSKKGMIKVKKNNKIGKILTDAVNSGEKVRLVC